MGILSFWKSTPKATTKPTQTENKTEDDTIFAPKPDSNSNMNGALEVNRPTKQEVTVFEFGSVAASTDKVTLAGFCPVSDDLEPCRWAILPAEDQDAPQFRVVF